MERALTDLKGRWRQLLHMNATLKNIPQGIGGACVLYNLCIDNGDIYTPDCSAAEMSTAPASDDDTAVDDGCMEISQHLTSSQKRDYIA